VRGGRERRRTPPPHTHAIRLGRFNLFLPLPFLLFAVWAESCSGCPGGGRKKSLTSAAAGSGSHMLEERTLPSASLLRATLAYFHARRTPHRIAPSTFAQHARVCAREPRLTRTHRTPCVTQRKGKSSVKRGDYYKKVKKATTHTRHTFYLTRDGRFGVGDSLWRGGERAGHGGEPACVDGVQRRQRRAGGEAADSGALKHTTRQRSFVYTHLDF
jgi:hypothetical protein